MPTCPSFVGIIFQKHSGRMKRQNVVHESLAGVSKCVNSQRNLSQMSLFTQVRSDTMRSQLRMRDIEEELQRLEGELIKYNKKVVYVPKELVTTVGKKS